VSSPQKSGGYVLLVVLAAVAVLSVVAAFVHSETENQLVLTSALKGQSVAAARATLAAEAYLAQYKANYPTNTINLLPSFSSYAEALDGGLGATLNDALTDYSPGFGSPALALDLATGGGAQWCVDVWRLNRGPNVAPWTVIEAFGYYGFRQSNVSTCVGLANSGTVAVSQLEVQIEQSATAGGSGSSCPACGTGSAGGY
jgi:hypothetical protein